MINDRWQLTNLASSDNYGNQIRSNTRIYAVIRFQVW